MSMPPGVQPPDPNLPPEPPTAGYTVPPQFTPSAYPGGAADPLVLPVGASFGAWFTKVQEVAKRSWKSALILCTAGIAVPEALVVLVRDSSGYFLALSVTGIGSFFDLIGSVILGGMLTIAVCAVGAYVAAAAWAAGVWALVQEAATGRAASLGKAFGYGMRRAAGMWPWTFLAATMVYIGKSCLVLPGVYLAFGLSMFGFVAVFERGVNPIGRSFNLTHNSNTIGPTIGKVAILLGVYIVVDLILSAIFVAIAVAIALAVGHTGAFGYNISRGVIEAIGTVLTGPAIAVLLLGLMPTYLELRARETPVNTPALQAQLG
jgi:hypothetical protein